MNSGRCWRAAAEKTSPDKQKTIRSKTNGLGIFAAPEVPQDALNSDISAALIEQTATLVLLPNPECGREGLSGRLEAHTRRV